jgi:hypothetical protein
MFKHPALPFLVAQIAAPAIADPHAGLVQYALTMGVGGLVAYGMFLVYRKDILALLAQWKGQSEMLMAVVTKNTEATTALTVLMREKIEADRSLVDRLRESMAVHTHARKDD